MAVAHDSRDLDAVLAALAHEARRHILLVAWFGGGTLTAGDLAARFSHSWPTTSRHLRVLEEAGLMRVEKQGRERVYKVADDRLAIVSDWLRWFRQRPAEPEVATPSLPPDAILRNIALAYPEAREVVEGGERTIRLGRGAFVVFRSTPALGFSVSTRLPNSRAAALRHSFAEPMRYKLGTSDWVLARFGPGDDVPIELLWAWIDESYRSAAPKRLTADLPPPPSYLAHGQ
jgi:DNA-binding transcriptional ArsR family regulator